MFDIRPYEKADFEAVRNLGKEAAPEEFQANELQQELYVILYLDYHLEYEPENVIVAADENGNIVGYAAAAVHYEFFRKKMVGNIKRQALRISYGESRRIDRILKKIKHLHPGLSDIITLFVSEAADDSQAERRLLDALSDHLDSIGEPYMTVYDIPADSPMHAKYEALGFEDHGMPAKDGTVAMICPTKENPEYREKGKALETAAAAADLLENESEKEGDVFNELFY